MPELSEFISFVAVKSGIKRVKLVEQERGNYPKDSERSLLFSSLQRELSIQRWKLLSQMLFRFLQVQRRLRFHLEETEGLEGRREGAEKKTP